MKDIKLDDAGDLLFKNGDFAVHEGASVPAQDIFVQTLVLPGGFFYDESCGSSIPHMLNDNQSSTDLLQRELKRLVVQDERIDIDSISVTELDGKHILSFVTVAQEDGKLEV